MIFFYDLVLEYSFVFGYFKVEKVFEFGGRSVVENELKGMSIICFLECCFF